MYIKLICCYFHYRWGICLVYWWWHGWYTYLQWRSYCWCWWYTDINPSMLSSCHWWRLYLCVFYKTPVGFMCAFIASGTHCSVCQGSPDCFILWWRQQHCLWFTGQCSGWREVVWLRRTTLSQHHSMSQRWYSPNMVSNRGGCARNIDWLGGKEIVNVRLNMTLIIAVNICILF